MKEIIIIRIVNGDDVAYDIEDEDGNYLGDSEDLMDAMNAALLLAEEHGVEFVKMQVASRLC